VERLRAPVYREKEGVLEKAVSHMEWEQAQERARRKAEEEEDQERTAMALIDWHDFVIVETIEFFDDEPDLPAPASYDQLMSGYIPAAPEPEMVKDVEEEMETEMEMEMETEEAAPEPVEEPAPSSPPRSPETMEPEMPPLPPPDTKLKILKEPIKRPEPKKHVPMMLCPRCKTLVPQNEYNEHMRIELLDPKFREEQKILQARKKDAMAPMDVSKNLEAFSKYRSDIFGSGVETEIGKAVGEDDRPTEKVTWDGHSNSISRTTSAAADQMSSIIANKPVITGDEKPSIGPHSVHAAPTPAAAPVRPPIITVVGGTPSMPRPVIAPAVPAVPQPPLMAMPPMMPPMPYGMPPMMPGMMGMPIPGMYPYGMHQPPPPEEEPAAKRQKMEEQNLIPEQKFLEDYPSPVNIVVQVPPAPADKNEWNFQGQQLEFILAPTSTITNVKEKIKEALGMPPNKQKLKGPVISILKDDKTLAYYNTAPGTVFVLGVKERGGRKK
jgi:splicing factor 3A subunit 1